MGDRIVYALGSIQLNQNLIEYIASLPVFVIVNLLLLVSIAIVGVVLYKKFTTPLRRFVWLTFFWMILGIAEIVVPFFFRTYNIWLFSLATLFDFAFFTSITHIWLKDTRSRYIPATLFFIYLIIWGISKATFEPPGMSDDVTGTVATVFKIVVSILLLLRMFSEPEFSWSTDERFWIISGFIIHAVCTILLFSSFSFLLKYAVDELRKLYTINWIVNSVVYCLYLRAYICAVKKTRPIHTEVFNMTQ
ncbi:MAG: hypothetical protein N3A63_08145 [Bacteroidetes bacterium]|nr:hypothetical protein [Bacteroidota bacterium]